MQQLTKQKRYRNFLEQKYKRLVEESYNLKYTDHGMSDILAFEALILRQKMTFLQL